MILPGAHKTIDTIKLHGWETGCAHALFARSDVTSSLSVLYFEYFVFKSTAVQLQIHRLVSCLEMVVSVKYNYDKKIAVFVKFSVFRTVGHVVY